MSATGNGGRRIAAAPVAVRVVLAAALAVQIGWHAWWPDPRAEARPLRPAPPADVLRLTALGDETALAKLLILRLQAHDNQPGVSIPFMDLDYHRLAGWLDAIVDLDPRAGYPLLAAARLYGSVPDPARQRVMFDLVHRRFLEDPGRRWPWLAHVVVFARHRLGDPALSLRYARTLAEHATGPAVPARVRNMSAFIAADMGEAEAARALAAGRPGGHPPPRRTERRPPGSSPGRQPPPAGGRNGSRPTRRFPHVHSHAHTAPIPSPAPIGIDRRRGPHRTRQTGNPRHEPKEAQPMPRKQHGFTIVEIAIVLIIIGLLLGGVLKGQELVNSARVRNLADTNSGIQAAYYGFIDRYRQVPGDMTATAAASAIGDATITVGGDADGRVDDADWGEASALWVHLTRAGFLQGSYNGGATDSTTYRDAEMAPRNAFDGYMLLGRTRDYSTTDGAPTATRTVRLGLVLGDNIPVDIARELDVKIDDQRPLTGSLRFTGTATFSHAGVSEATTLCMASADSNEYDVAGDAQNCNLVYIY